MFAGLPESLIQFICTKPPVCAEFKPLFAVISALACFKLLNSTDNSTACRPSGSDQQKLRRTFFVDLMGNIRMLQQCRYLRGEYQLFVIHEVEKRLNAYPVTGKKYPVFSLVIDRKCEYTVESVHTAFAPFYIAFQHDFRIRACVEAEILGKFTADLIGIVQFAVIDDSEPAMLHRLSASVNVDDRKPCMYQRCLTVKHDTTLVRASSYESALHFLIDLHILTHILSKTDSTCNSAHNHPPPLYGIRHAVFAQNLFS